MAMTTADNNDHPFSHHCLLHRGRLISHAFTLLQHIETKNVLRCRSNIALLRFLFRRRRPFSSEFFFSPFPHGHVGNCCFRQQKRGAFGLSEVLNVFQRMDPCVFQSNTWHRQEKAPKWHSSKTHYESRDEPVAVEQHILYYASNTIFLTLYVFTLSLCLSLSLVICGNAIISSTLLYFRYR
jgi:hypothetical protein